MTTVDWIAAGRDRARGARGLRRGLVGGALSLAGIAAGAVFGAQLAPQLLGGERVAVHAARRARRGGRARRSLLEPVRRWPGRRSGRPASSLPPLRALDSLGGLLLGAAAGARARLGGRRGRAAPARPDRAARGRAAVDGSCSALNERRAARAAAGRDRARRPVRRDRRAARPTSTRPTRAPRRVPACAAARTASSACTGRRAASVSRAPAGSPAPRLVVTDAHVVAGAEDAAGRPRRRRVPRRGRRRLRRAQRRRRAARRRAAAPRRSARRRRTQGAAVAILGYPENGPFTATPAASAQTGDVSHRRRLRPRAGRGARSRRCAASSGTATRAGRRSTRTGAVQTTVFAARLGGSDAGYGVPTALVREALAGAGDARGLDRPLRGSRR